MPMYTPQSLPYSVEGRMPAFSKVSQLISSSKRCCGSINDASRGEIPKNPASNPDTSPIDPAAKVYEEPGCVLLGCRKEGDAQRPGSTWVTRSRPASKSSQK